MSIFEFVLVTVSLIMALGITLLLRHIAAIIRYRKSIELYWVALTWMALQFVTVTWVWWSLWDFAAVEWTYPRFFYLLAGPTLHYIVISMLVSTDVSKPNASLIENFSSIRVPFMLVLSAVQVFVALDGWVFGVEPLWNSLRALQVALLFLYLTAAISPKPIVQNSVIVAVTGLFIYGLIFLRYLPGAFVSS